MFGIVFETTTATIMYVEPGSAAEQTGLQARDRLLSWNGSTIGDLAQQEHIRALREAVFATATASADAKTSILIERDGQQIELVIPPSARPFPLPERYRSKETVPTVTQVLSPYYIISRGRPYAAR